MTASVPLPATGPWPAVARLVDRAPSLDDLAAHKLQLVAARHWRSTGRALPSSAETVELTMLARVYAMKRTLAAARAAYDGDMMVFKGLGVGLRYPDATLRPSADIDLLVDDPQRAQAALIAAGFEPVGSKEDEFFDGLQHLRPLVHPDLGRIPIEVHSHVSWVRWVDPPSTASVLEAGIPSITGIAGLTEPCPAHHAVILAAHSCETTALGRLSELLDIAVVSADVRPEEIDMVARDWGVERMWRTYSRAINAAFFGAPAPGTLRVWARNLLAARDATVLENHVKRWLSPFWTRPRTRALPAALLALYEDLTPAPGESWSNKMHRFRAGSKSALQPVNQHTEEMGPDGIQPRFKRRNT